MKQPDDKLTQEDILKTCADLKQTMADVPKLDPNGPFVTALCKILDKAHDGTLEILANAEINYISPLARNRLIRRKAV